MERADFDQLCKKAYASESAIADKDSLWLEVFKLREWYFIARGELPNVYPYMAQAHIIEPNSHWIYAFTDFNRATFYAKKNNLYNEKQRSPILTIPNNDNLIPWIQQFIDVGVKGVYFNADGHGFYAPIVQLMPIHKHLTSVYPADL